MTEDETVGWHHQLNRPEFEQAPGDGEAEGSVVCSSPWGWGIKRCHDSDEPQNKCDERGHMVVFHLHKFL